MKEILEARVDPALVESLARRIDALTKPAIDAERVERLSRRLPR